MTERYFFLHLQKTGGSALRARLQHLFGKRAVYPRPEDGNPIDAVIRPAHLIESIEARGEEIRVITGHFPLATLELLPWDCRTFTLLREPVERTLSFLRHQVKWGNTPTDNLEELYEDPLRAAMIRNHMTKMLALDAQETLHGGAILADVEMNAERLHVACQRLGDIDVVGIQERHDDFVAQLEQEFNWDLGPQRRVNTTAATPIDPAFRERIAEDNALDVALYQYALELTAPTPPQ
jgi:hypothetical protein